MVRPDGEVGEVRAGVRSPHEEANAPDFFLVQTRSKGKNRYVVG